MPSIEFVDDDGAHGDEHPVELPESTSPDRVVGAPAWSRVAPGIALIGAAGLLAGAPFADVFRLRYGSTTDRASADVQDETVDGWGRVRFRVRSGLENQHATRFGIALCVIAGVLLLTAAVTLAPRVLGRWHARVRRWTPGVLLGSLGTALGVLGSAALALQTELDNAGTFSDGDISLEITTGAFFWLGAAALALIALALALPLVTRGRATADRAGDLPPTAPQADLAHG